MTQSHGFIMLSLPACKVRLIVSIALLMCVLNDAWSEAPVPYPRIETGAHTAKISRIGIDRSERWLVSASTDKTARVWDLNSGQAASHSASADRRRLRRKVVCGCDFARCSAGRGGRLHRCL